MYLNSSTGEGESSEDSGLIETWDVFKWFMIHMRNLCLLGLIETWDVFK